MTSFLAKVAEIKAANTPAPPQTPRDVRPVVGGTREEKYLNSAIAAECDRVANATPGTRNDTLNRAAYSLGQLVAGGALPEHVVLDALRDAARHHTTSNDPMPLSEIDATIASGLRGGMAEPRGIPAPDPTNGLTDLVAPQHRQTLAVPPTEPPAPPTTPAHEQPAVGAEPDVERTSWWPRDLTTTLDPNHPGEPPPALLTRSDGANLLYAGRINALIGESESGKTWIALLAVQQTLAAGGRVLYLDFEDSATGIVGRLQALGVTPADLATFAYVSPDETLHPYAQRDLLETLETEQQLIVVDGVNAAMTLLGLDLTSNRDATQFSQTVLRPLARTGAAVLTVDHVTKNRDDRGSYAIGAQAKRADITGTALLVDVLAPFGPGTTGRLRLTVGKDRQGQVRAVSAGTKHAGVAELVSGDNGAVTVTIQAPDLRPPSERPAFRPTALMERVSRYLESVDGPVSGHAIETGVDGKAAYIRDALSILVTESYVERSSGPRGAVLHKARMPYREAQDGLIAPTSSTSSRPRPDLVPDEVESPFSDLVPDPLPLRGGDEVAGTSTTTSTPTDLVPATGEPEKPDAWWDR